MMTMMMSAGAARAQEPADVPRRIRESVSLETDGAVSKKLGAVQEYLAAKQWNQAVDLLADVSTQHGDLLAPAGPGLYVRVSQQCQRILAAAPGEALAVYRRQVDPQAKQWFEAGRAGDDEALQRVVRSAFVSSVGDDAVNLLAERAWERGEPAVARRLWERLLPPERNDSAGALRYPDPAMTAAEVRARLTLCSLASGEPDRARSELESFQRNHGDAEGRLAGETGRLATILQRVLAEAKTWTFPTHDEAATTFGVNPRRSGGAREPVVFGAPEWAERLTPPAIVPSSKSVSPNRRPLCFHPLAYRDLVFLNDGRRIHGWKLFASDLAGRRADPAWPAGEGESGVIWPPPSANDDPPQQPIREPQGSPQFTLTISDGRLYAKVGSPVTGKSRAVGAELISNIVCLDLARQGELVWKAAAQEVFQGEDWAFEGTPVVQDGRAWAVARRSQPQTQLNVVCFDASGNVLWNRKVCTALAPPVETKNLMTHLLLTLGDDGLYLSTNLGVVLALDPRDGAPLWASTYESRDAEKTAFGAEAVGTLTPCVTARGVIAAAPLDSDRIFALDAASGAVRWSRKLGAGGPKDLLGATADGALIVSGESLQAIDLQTGRTRWTVDTETAGQGVCGRGALAGDLVYWPRREELLVVNQKTGAKEGKPNLRERGGAGGNLVVADGMLLIAEAERLVAYGAYGLLRKDAERILSERPRDASRHLRLAALREATGDFDAAAEGYRRTMAAAQGDDEFGAAWAADKAREWLFQSLRRRGETRAAAGRGAEALELLRQAADAAPDAPRAVAARVSLARAAERFDDPRIAAGAWLDLLRDGEGSPRRGAVLSRRDIGETQVPLDRLARQSLSRLHDRHASALAGLFEPTADTRPSARQAADSAALESRLRRFGFARDAPDVLLELVDRCRREGQPARAAVLLHEHSSLASMRAVRPELNERLEQLSRSLGFPVGEEQTPQAAPWRRAWSIRTGGDAAPLTPSGTADASIACLLTQDVRLTCRNLTDGAVRWTRPAEAPIRWAAFSGVHLLIGDDASATALSPEDGSTRWRLPLTTRNPPGDIDPPVRFHSTANRLLIFDRRKQVLAVDAWTGRLLWEFTARGRLRSAWHADDRQVIVQRAADGRTLRIDAADGEATDISPAADHEPWRVPPAVFGTTGVAATLTNHRVVAFRSTSPAAPNGWRYDGALSWANAAPELIAAGDLLLLIVDGDTLARLDGTTGRRLWSRPIARRPLPEPARAIALADRRAFVAADGFVRAFDLEDGALAWEEFVGGPDLPRRVFIAGRFLVVAPARRQIAPADSPDDESSIVVLDSAEGRPVQRLGLNRASPHRPEPRDAEKPDGRDPGPAANDAPPDAMTTEVDVRIAADSLVVRNGGTTTIFRPWPADPLAERR